MQPQRIGSSGDKKVYGFSLNPPFPLELSLTFFLGWAAFSGSAVASSTVVVVVVSTGSTNAGVSSGEGASDSLNLLDSGSSVRLSASRLRSLQLIK